MNNSLLVKATESLWKLDDIEFMTNEVNRRLDMSSYAHSVSTPHHTTTAAKPINPYAIRSVLSNHKKNAFTVVWEDGTTTVVHCHKCDEWDDEKALAMCFAKKALGNKGNFNNVVNDALLNKMKVIYTDEEKEVINGKMSLKRLAKQVEEAGQVITKPTKEILDLSDTLRGILAPVEDEATVRADECDFYSVYLRDISTGMNLSVVGVASDIEKLHKRITEYAKNNDLGLYFRYWASEDGLYIDYGSHSTYMFVPDMTLDKFARR